MNLDSVLDLFCTGPLHYSDPQLSHKILPLLGSSDQQQVN